MRRGLLRSMAEILPEPNTFIGGMGSIITTPQEFINQGLTEIIPTDIKNWQIDENNNISFFAGVNYTVGFNTFLNNNSLTYFIDLDGKFSIIRANTTSNTFTSTSLKYLYLPNTLENRRITAPNLEKADATRSTGSRIRQRFYINSKVERIIDNATTLNNNNTAYTFYPDLISIERLSIKSASSMNNLIADLVYSGYSFSNFKTGGKIYYNSALGVANRFAYAYAMVASYTTAGRTLTVNGLVYTSVIGAATQAGEFQCDLGFEFIQREIALAINNDTREGTVPNGVICVNINTLTNNLLFMRTTITGAAANDIDVEFEEFVPVGLGDKYGASGFFTGGFDVHNSLAYARDFEGAILVETTADVTVNPPTNLSFSNQTSNSVDLNFTEPTPNAKGTECYDVWVDDGTLWRKLFYYDEISGSGSTLDLQKVIDDVGSLSGVKIKIRTMDSHMTFSEFSNEITIT